MSHTASPSLVRQLGSLFEVGSAAGLSDRQLLERFTCRMGSVDEPAFAALVARHGPMVLGVCRQLLGDHHHAEDAYQAVFLVLACQARSIRDPDSLSNWLYGVAVRTARKARGRLARRRKTEEECAVSQPEERPAVGAEQMIDREHAEALHHEIDRLPADFRAPLVLCYFEGLSPDEAARRLKWPSGTLRSRLVRARDKLRRGLTRRGVVLSGTALAAALTPRFTSASVSSRLCDSTTRAAIHFAARHAAGGAFSASAAALAQEVLRTMLLNKLKLTAKSLLVLAAVATGAGFVTRSLAMQEPPVKQPTDSQVPVAQGKADLPRPQPTPEPAISGRMTVTGRVLGPDGKPAVGVPVDIVGAPRAPETGTDVDGKAHVLLGQGAAGADGHFRIEASPASSSRFSDIYALAGASGPGSGFGSVRLHVDAEQPAAEIRLRHDQVIRGTLVDVNGQPAAGVEIGVSGVYGASPTADGGRFDCPGPGRGYVWSGSPEGIRAWPKAVTTDAQGRFALAGIGRGLSVSLSIRDPRFAQQRFDFDAGDRDATKSLSLALHPAKLIEGRVLAADTGQPIANAVISARASFGTFGAMVTTRFRADGQGRFKINPYAGDYFRMRAFPAEGQPYLPQETELAWTTGAVKKEIDLKLARGVLIRGKATEQGTGRPVAGASVQFFPMNRSGDIVYGFEAIVAANEDGSFQLAVPPGKGYLMVLGPTLDYIPQEMGGGKLYGGGQPGGGRFYAHDVIAYEVKAGVGPRDLRATLKPGKTVRGRLVGPAGQTVEDAVILSRQQIDPLNLTWQGHSFIRAHDGRFELHGFDPEKATPVYFLDADHQWGVAIELPGEPAIEDLTVRLQPCGQAKVRFVGPDGKPAAKLNLGPYFTLTMTSGPNRNSFVDRGEQLAADAAFMPSVDFKHYPNNFATDAEGRVTLPALIPGAPYRISDWSTVNVREKGNQIRKDFIVKPGETLDLGDIVVEQPSS
jgi:RNA polymerase sigma factor (sigma-70 family)